MLNINVWTRFNIWINILQCLGQGLDVVKLCCGPDFCLAVGRNGSIYTWGKGDHYRLGHGSDDNVR
jgi:alpha-tubulin suppressor-like RCC1 family protein